MLTYSSFITHFRHVCTRLLCWEVQEVSNVPWKQSQRGARCKVEFGEKQSVHVHACVCVVCVGGGGSYSLLSFCECCSNCCFHMWCEGRETRSTNETEIISTEGNRTRNHLSYLATYFIHEKIISVSAVHSIRVQSFIRWWICCTLFLTFV